MSLIDLPDDNVDLIFRQEDLNVPYTDGFKVDSEELKLWCSARDGETKP